MRSCVFIASCYSLVEEGEQVSHDDEGFAWHRLQDFFDVNGTLLEALHRWNTPQTSHPEDYSYNQEHKHRQREKKNRLQDERLTDAGYEVMEDFLWEEGLVQSSKIELQDAGDGVHVVIILVPCQRILT